MRPGQAEDSAAKKSAKSSLTPLRTSLFRWVLPFVLVLLFLLASHRERHSTAADARHPALLHPSISSRASAEEKAIEANTVTALFDRSSTGFQHRKPIGSRDPNRTIEVGLHVENLHQLSLKDKNYWVEGWYWLRWPQSIQNILQADKITTDRMVEFTNQIEDSSITISPEESDIVELPGNTFYQSFRFSGKFYVDDLDLIRFPFQQISLPITIETRPSALSCTAETCIQLLADPVNVRSLVGQFAAVNGYDIKASEITPFIHQYKSNFGIGAPSAFGAVDFSIIYKTNPWAAFSQSILPLLVIIGIVIASPSLPGSIGDVRLAIPTTALLTMIFLQQTYRSEIPPLSYLCFLDWLYLYAYVLSIVFFLLFCWGTYIYTVAEEGRAEQVVRRIDKVDSFFQIGAILVLALVVPLAWFFT
jgi:phosphatidylglycerophosphate synthase